MTGDSDSTLRDNAPGPILGAGARLREARNAAGLSIDAVAQQLKLAPRQVRALEDNDFAQLPGRTFVRGFTRNYARLLRLDSDALLATLPDAGETPSLDRPSLAPSPRAMGELPADLHTKPSSARWAIPLALVAIIAIATYFEWTRPGSELVKILRPEKAVSLPASPMVAGRVSAPASTVTTPPSSVESSAITTLPNPLAAASGQSGPSAAPVVGPASSPPEVVASAPARAGDALLVLVFRGTSWAEIKDSKGTVVLSTIGYPGATHAVGGGPPYEVVLGNAEAVQVTYRGELFDSTPFVKQNVAKFSLQ